MSHEELMQRRLDRERRARKEAEHIAETRTRELFDKNRDLVELNQNLESIVAERTADLSLTRDRALEANRAKSSFLANMSHELRTPLNAIIGYSELLMEEAADRGDTQVLPELAKIVIAGKHLGKLINEILDLSKIEAGRMELDVETFSVAEMLTSVEIATRPVVEKNRNAFTLHTMADCGDMHTDFTKVRQVLINLVGNAGKFTSDGTVRLETVRRPDTISFAVHDSGIGIALEHQENLFEAFRQADMSTARKYGGTGLGLTICHHLCRLMGGHVRVHSVLGAGSTFTVELPIQAPKPGESRRSRLSHSSAAWSTRSLAAENAPVILIIDDDPNALELMAYAIAKEGLRYVAASSGEEGLRLARRIKPAAITLDVCMEAMDGWAVLAALKSDLETTAIPVMLVTIVDDRRRAFELGAAAYLTKPIDRQHLSSILRGYRTDLPKEA